MKSRGGSVTRLATPLKAWAQRFTLLALTGLALGLMMMDKAESIAVERLRTAVIDAVTPILDAMSRPVAAANQVLDWGEEIVSLRSENARLREENNRLLQWQQAARRFEGENDALRRMLNLGPDPAASFVSARVVGDNGGAFVRTVLVGAGSREGVRKNQAAITGDGLAGRVIEAGERASRVLLITDINSRIPVMVERTRDRAVLAGDNSPSPVLVHLAPDAELAIGDRVVTSGNGGIFPPGLPVGVVARLADGEARVEPLIRWQRMEFVRLVDYEAAGLTDLGSGPEASRRDHR